MLFFFASFAQINCICLALASSSQRCDGGGELAGDFIYRHLSLRRIEGAPSAGAQPPLQFTRDDLSCVIYIRLPSPRRPTCARSRSLSFLLDLFIFCQRCLCVYYSNQLFPPAAAPTPPSGNALTLRPCCRRAGVNLTAAASRIKAEGCGGGSWGQMLRGKRGRIGSW